MSKARSENLVIYLAKEAAKKPADLIKDIASLKSFSVKDDDKHHLGTLYVQARTSRPPPWGRFFEDRIPLSELGRVSSTAAVFHLVVDDRVLLVTFGHGWQLLESHHLEERFGLVATLNSISEDSIRSIDKSTLDTLGRLTRVQASREAAPSEFGFDIERDLLRAITGTPKDKTLGKRLSGLESLHAAVQVDLSSLKSLLSRYLSQYLKEDYKKTFPWIDHIGVVKDPILAQELDILMLSNVRKSQSDKCWLAIPELIDWSDVIAFRYGLGGKHSTVYDIGFDSLAEDWGLIRDQISLEFLRARTVYAVDANGESKRKWSAYRCVYSEVERVNRTYILSDGKWYKIDGEFVDEVNEFYKQIRRYPTRLPDYNDETETAYNARVAENDAKYALMDCKNIPIGGGYGKVEFCDLFTRDRHLIHVKRYGGAGVLSHLFSQGVVSGQLLASTSAEFREKVNERLPSDHKLHNVRTRPAPSDYQIVFAIISAESGSSLTLPFFSRLTARHAVQTLGSYGYKVSLAKISVASDKAKTRKFPLGARSRPRKLALA